MNKEYTGFRDDKGVKICEGDTIQFRRRKDYPAKTTAKIEFVQGAFLAKIFSEEENPSAWGHIWLKPHIIDLYDIEVIKA